MFKKGQIDEALARLDRESFVLMHPAPNVGNWINFVAQHSLDDAIPQLVARGVDINGFRYSSTPLESAIGRLSTHPDAATRLPQMLRTLFANGANPNVSRPLIAALNPRVGDEATRLALVRLLVEHGADVNRLYDLYGRSEHAFTALEWAAGWAEMCAYLRSVGAVERPPQPASPPSSPRGKRK